MCERGISLLNCGLLTDIHPLGDIPIGCTFEIVFVLVGDKFPDAAHKSIEHRQNLRPGHVSGASQENGLSKGDSREESL